MARLVQIEMPWIGLGCGEAANKYLKACIRDSLVRDEVPWSSITTCFLSGALYQSDEEQMAESQVLAKEMALRADAVAFYVDRGMSAQMVEVHRWCLMRGKIVEKRTIYQR